jgi:SCP-2 sterol transfer family
MDQKSIPPQLGERLRADPVLADFLSPFPRLTDSEKSDLGRTFERFGELIGGSEVRARVQFGVLQGDGEGETVRSWSLELGPDACAVSAERVHRPDVEVLVAEETWRRLADGTLAPLEAFGRGEMRVRGDIQLARRLVQLLRRG